jgi:hypothetical protein
MAKPTREEILANNTAVRDRKADQVMRNTLKPFITKTDQIAYLRTIRALMLPLSDQVQQRLLEEFRSPHVGMSVGSTLLWAVDQTRRSLEA